MGGVASLSPRNEDVFPSVGGQSPEIPWGDLSPQVLCLEQLKTEQYENGHGIDKIRSDYDKGSGGEVSSPEMGGQVPSRC